MDILDTFKGLPQDIKNKILIHIIKEQKEEILELNKKILKIESSQVNPNEIYISRPKSQEPQNGDWCISQ